MRLKREMIHVLFKTANAGEASTIEATFASPQAMERYFVNHDLARKHRLGEDGEIYPKFRSRQVKFYSLEEAKRKKVEKEKGKDVVDVELAENVPEEVKEDDETKEAGLDELLEEDEERPSTDEGDK